MDRHIDIQLCSTIQTRQHTHLCTIHTPHWWTSSYSQLPSPWQIAVTCYYTHHTDGHHHKVNSPVHELGLQRIAVACFYTHRICIPFYCTLWLLVNVIKRFLYFILLQYDVFCNASDRSRMQMHSSLSSSSSSLMFTHRAWCNHPTPNFCWHSPCLAHLLKIAVSNGKQLISLILACLQGR